MEGPDLHGANNDRQQRLGDLVIRRNRIAFASDRDGNFEIYVMDSDGANQTRLTSNAAAEFDPNFSPDGTKIVFDRNRNAPEYDVFVMDDDGAN